MDADFNPIDPSGIAPPHRPSGVELMEYSVPVTSFLPSGKKPARTSMTPAPPKGSYSSVALKEIAVTSSTADLGSAPGALY